MIEIFYIFSDFFCLVDVSVSPFSSVRSVWTSFCIKKLLFFFDFHLFIHVVQVKCIQIAIVLSYEFTEFNNFIFEIFIFISAGILTFTLILL